MLKLNRIGPKTEPWGTPDRIVWKEEYVLLILTACFCLFKLEWAGWPSHFTKSNCVLTEIFIVSVKRAVNLYVVCLSAVFDNCWDCHVL